MGEPIHVIDAHRFHVGSGAFIGCANLAAFLRRIVFVGEAAFAAGNGRVRAHIVWMANVRATVEVTAPDGTKSFWVAAVVHKDAVAAVRAVIPADHLAELSIRRFLPGPKLGRLRWGDVRKVEL